MSKFAGVTDESLATQYAEKKTALAALVEAAGENPTDEQVEQGEALAAEMAEIETEQSTRAEAAASRASRFAALQTLAQGEPEEEPEEAEEEPEADESAEESEDGSESGEESGSEATAEVSVETTAGGKTVKAATQRKSVAELARRAKRPEAPEQESAPRMSIVAAAETGFAVGKEIDLDDVAAAVINRTKGFAPPSGDGSREELHKFAVASFRPQFDADLVIDRNSDDQKVVDYAANESRLASAKGKGSLVAAGGWCAPSETLYDLPSDESLEGMVSIPEVQVKRGGIRFTRGPQFSDFYANAGFVQTEAQAIAGTAKTCVEITCPSFEEVRLDAVGICLKVPILTNAGYPELVRRFTEGTLVAHQHMINSRVIDKMVTIAGSAIEVTGLGGSVVSDTMEALERVCDGERERYRLPLGRSLEVVVPFWVRGAMRSDLARRAGVAAEAITDQQVDAHFRARKVNVQYVYDWTSQALPTADDAGTTGVDEQVVYPSTFEALVYPAGTYFKGTADVINLSAVYDAASLAENTYTGLFAEQGLLVGSRQYRARRLTMPVCTAGQTGASDIACA
jgi:hypothetical protein